MSGRESGARNELQLAQQAAGSVAQHTTLRHLSRRALDFKLPQALTVGLRPESVQVRTAECPGQSQHPCATANSLTEQPPASYHLFAQVRYGYLCSCTRSKRSTDESSLETFDSEATVKLAQGQRF